MENKNSNWAESLTNGQPIARVIAASNPADKASTNKTSQPKPNGQLPQMHIGRGQRYGNLTWFPIWTSAPIAERDYVTAAAAGVVSVVEGSNPTVGFLQVQNSGNKPVLLLEGALLEGGWQHRALTRTMLVNANSTTEMPVVCVEAGRWGGVATQHLGKKSAPAGVRRAMRGMSKGTNGVVYQAAADQGAVWDSVRDFSARNNKQQATESLVGVKNELEAELAALKLELPKPVFGQRGVLIAIGGVPLAIEVFDHPDTLAERFETILDAYLPESLIKPFVECRSQIARDFVARIEKLGVEPTGDDGRLRNKADKYVAAEAVLRGEELLHMSALNAAHELVLAA